MSWLQLLGALQTCLSHVLREVDSESHVFTRNFETLKSHFLVLLRYVSLSLTEMSLTQSVYSEVASCVTKLSDDKGDNISLWAACNSSFSMRRTANGAC